MTVAPLGQEIDILSIRLSEGTYAVADYETLWTFFMVYNHVKLQT